MKNFDCILPPNIRQELLPLERHPRRKPLRRFYQIAVVLLLFAGLRHLNTVPHREWKTTYTTGGIWTDNPAPGDGGVWDQKSQRVVFKPNPIYWPLVKHEDSVYTAEELFGSSYRGSIDGKDIGISSKNFEDGLRLMPRYHRK